MSEYDAIGAPPRDAPFATGSTPPPPAFAAGWAAAAMGIHSTRQMARPILISLSIPGYDPIGVDLRHHTYAWPSPLTDFPREPGEVQVGTYSVEGDSPGFAGKSRGLDPLLWMIGLNAFPGRIASWLRYGDKYRLKRWPDLDVLPHTPDQLRAIRTLAKGLMTVDKLAQRTPVGVGAAHDVVNALSLMGALRRVEAPDGAPMQPPPGEYDAPSRVRGRHVRRGG